MIKLTQHSIVYVVNNNYIDPLLASLNSLKLNSGLYEQTNIIILHTPGFDKHRLKNYDLIFKEFNEPQIKFSRNWGLNPASKFEIFKINGYKKILYLDCDTIILKDISDIFKIEGDVVITALKKIKNIIYNGTQKGFNAGVMVISEKYLNDKTYNDLIDLANRNLLTGNQNVLNFYFKDKISCMPLCYNTCLDQLKYINRKDIKILHFIEYKPWLNKSTKYIDMHLGAIEKFLLKRIYYRYV